MHNNILNKKYDFVFSLGEDCACTSYLRNFKIQNASYPFDWLTKASFHTRVDLLLNEFEDFLSINNFKFIEKTQKIIDNDCDYYENIKFDFYFYHDFPAGKPLEDSFYLVEQKYKRRITRLYSRIYEAKNVLIVWWSRDKILTTEDIILAEKKLNTKFGKNKIHILIFENNLDITDNEYSCINDNILKVTSNFAFYDINNPETEVMGNDKQSNLVFSQIKLGKRNKRYKHLILKTMVHIITALIPVKGVRKNYRKKLKDRFL